MSSLQRLNDSYDLSSNKLPGKVYILNHYAYKRWDGQSGYEENVSARTGTHADVGSLSESLSRHQFEVHTFTDNTRQDTLAIIQQAAEADYDRYGCVMFVVLTHGDEDGVLYAHDATFKTSEVWEPFKHNASLAGKPKIFIFNACRGEAEEMRIKIDARGESNHSQLLPNLPDFLLAYSTFDGNVSYRDSTSGSWYIQEFASELNDFSVSHDLLSLLTRVNMRVVAKYKAKSLVHSNVSMGQTSVFVSFLTTKIVISKESIMSTTSSVSQPSSSSTTDFLKTQSQLSAIVTDGKPNLQNMTDSDVYSSNHQIGGVALILYNTATKQIAMQYREKLINMKFKIVHEENVNQIERYQMIIQAYSSKATSCFVLFDLTEIADKHIKLQKSIDGLNPMRCRNLAGKPKVIILMNAQSTHTDSPRYDTLDTNKFCNEHSDFLVMHAYSKESRDLILENLRCSNLDLVSWLSSCIVRHSSHQSFSFLESTLKYKIIWHEKLMHNEEIKTLTLPNQNLIQVTTMDSAIEHFYFRTSELSTLKKSILESQRRCAVNVAVTGQAGTGKSHLVKKFLEVNDLEFSSTKVWIPCYTKQHLVEKYISLFGKYNITQQGNLQKDIDSLYWKINIEGSKKQVIVFDDVTSNINLEQYLPSPEVRSKFFIITTSLIVHDSWQSHVQQNIKLQQFTMQESQQFISSLAPNLSQKQIEAIVKNFGHLPLTLNVTAKFLNTSKVSLNKATIEKIRAICPSDLKICYPFSINKMLDSIFLRIDLDFDLNSKKQLIDTLLTLMRISYPKKLHKTYIKFLIKEEVNLETVKKLFHKCNIIGDTQSEMSLSPVINILHHHKLTIDQLYRLIANVIHNFKNILNFNDLDILKSIFNQFVEKISSVISDKYYIGSDEIDNITYAVEYIESHLDEIMEDSTKIQKSFMIILFCTLMLHISNQRKEATIMFKTLLNSPLVLHIYCHEILCATKQIVKYQDAEAVKMLLDIKSRKMVIASAAIAMIKSDQINKRYNFESLQDLLKIIFLQSEKLEINQKENLNYFLKELLFKLENNVNNELEIIVKVTTSTLNSMQFEDKTNTVKIKIYLLALIYRLKKFLTSDTISNYKSVQINQKESLEQQLVKFCTWLSVSSHQHDKYVQMKIIQIRSTALSLLLINKISVDAFKKTLLPSIVMVDNNEKRKELFLSLEKLRKNTSHEARQLEIEMIEKVSEIVKKKWLDALFLKIIIEVDVFHYVVRNCGPKMVRYFVDSGADSKVFDCNGNSLLHLAALKGHADVAKCLIEAGCDIDKINKDGNTALYCHAEVGHVEVVKLLLDAGGNFKVKNKYCNTALHVSAKNGHKNVVTRLLEAGADITAVGCYGYLPLHMAAQNGHLDVLKCLLDVGADVTVVAKNGLTALHLAAMMGHVEILKCLLKARAEISAQNFNGNTSLHFAAELNHINIVRCLLDAGADITIKSKINYTALSWATVKGNLDVVQFLLERGANVREVYSGGKTALHLAAEYGHVELVRYLLKSGADYTVLDMYGSPALHLAVMRDFVEVVKCALDAGVNISVRDSLGNTMLLVAVASGYYSMVKVLLEAGADVAEVNNDGNTSLFYAVSLKQLDLVEFLLLAGSDVTVVNKFGASIFDVADDEVTELINEYKPASYVNSSRKSTCIMC